MVKSFFNKIKNSFSKKNSEANKKKSLNPNNFKTGSEFVNNKSRVIKFNGNNYDSTLIDKETLNIYNLFEQSNSKINFFNNLLTNLRIDRGEKIIKLKYKLKEEESIS